MSIMQLKVDKDLNKTYCKSIANSIGDIIRYSLNDDFRKRSFDLFSVLSTKETEIEINKRLKSIIQNETLEKNSNKLKGDTHSSAVGDKENAKNELADDKETHSSITNSSQDILMPIENIFKRNWLEISSKKYKENIKRRKLNYYSEPQRNQISFSQNNMDFISCDSFSSNSQPSGSLSHFSSVSEFSGDSPDNCRERRMQSLKDDSFKYLNRKVKFQKHHSL